MSFKENHLKISTIAERRRKSFSCRFSEKENNFQVKKNENKNILHAFNLIINNNEC